MKIYHNPRCRKSREALALLEEKNVKVEIINYIKNPLSANELKDLLQLLGYSAEDLLRKNEDIFKDKYKGKSLRENEWITVMTDHPKLIERPIVVSENKAVVARPAEKLLSLL